MAASSTSSASLGERVVVTVQLSPGLIGFRCVRCDARQPIGDYFEGCPACDRAGSPASLAAEYGPTAPIDDEGRLPLRCPTYLGEGRTPLVPLPALAQALGLEGLWAKLESLNPTGSHKDRMSRFVVARAQQLGFEGVVAASSGNAGVSLAATAARAGIGATIITRRNAPGRWVDAIRVYGATVIESPDARARWVETRRLVEAGRHYPATNFRSPPVGSNPFGVQGYKAVAYEIVDALGSRAADAIVVPTERGDLLWGVFEGLRESQACGRLAAMPRLFASEPYPRVVAVLDGADHRKSFTGASAQASIAGSSVTWQTLAAVKGSDGGAVVVGDRLAASSRRDLARFDITAELCSTATLGALRRLIADGTVARGARVVLMITADGALAADGAAARP